jgi:hypothetical protein
MVSGGTGLGKTTLARPLIQHRMDRKGFVVVMVMKIRPDETILRDYRGFTRWERFKRRPYAHERNILLWPKLEGLPFTKALPIQREIFGEAYDILSEVGRWTVVTDDALYTCSNRFLRLADALAGLQVMGRSSGISSVVLTQRPSHIPLESYDSLDHVFIGATREDLDSKRLATLGGRQAAREIQERVSELPRYSFLWVPVRDRAEPEVINLAE